MLSAARTPTDSWGRRTHTHTHTHILSLSLSLFLPLFQHNPNGQHKPHSWVNRKLGPSALLQYCNLSSREGLTDTALYN